MKVMKHREHYLAINCLYTKTLLDENDKSLRYSNEILYKRISVGILKYEIHFCPSMYNISTESVHKIYK